MFLLLVNRIFNTEIGIPIRVEKENHHQYLPVYWAQWHIYHRAKQGSIPEF